MRRVNTFIILLITAISSIASASTQKVFFEKDTTLPLVYINILIGVGSAHDPQDKAGLCSLGSKMLLRGTLNNSKTDYYRKLEQLGGQISVDVRSEGVVYRAAVLSENLAPFLELVSETFVKPKFPAEELRKLKDETESLILEQKSSDKALAGYHFQKFFYGSHPYSTPLLGTRKSIQKIDHKDIAHFHSKYFGGDSLTLFVSGDTEKSVVEKWFNDLTIKLTALHPDAGPAPGISKPEIPAGRRALIVDKPKTTQTQVLIGGVGLRPEYPGFYAIQLANNSFGGSSFQARLMTEIRVKRGWTYGAANTFRFGIQPRHYTMYFFPKVADTVPAINLSLQLFEDFIKNGITHVEFEFSRDSLVNNAPFQIDTSQKRIENVTTEHMIKFPEDFYKNFADNIADVKEGEITPVLKKFFNPNDLTLVVVGDAKALKGELSKVPGFSNPKVINYLEE